MPTLPQPGAELSSQHLPAKGGTLDKMSELIQTGDEALTELT